MAANLLSLRETAEDANRVAGCQLTDAKKLCRWRDAGEGPEIIKVAGRYYTTEKARRDWYTSLGLLESVSDEAAA